MARAAQIAVDECNEAGGIGGAPVTSEVVDDRGDPARGVEVAESLSARPEVAAVVGHYNSDVTLETSLVYADADLPMVTPIVSNPALTERGLGNVFRFTNRDDVTAGAIAGYLRTELGKSRAMVVETTTTYGTSMAGEFARAFTEAGGEVPGRYPVAEGRRDFAALVGGLPPGFDVLFYGGSFEGAAVLDALRSAGLDQLFAAGDGCWDRQGFLEPAGASAEAGEGVLVLAASPELGRVGGSAEFARRYTAQHGPIGNYAVNSYDATRLLLAALATAYTQTPRPSRRDVIAALQRAEFDGIAYPQPAEWDERGDNLAAGTFLNTVQDGRFRQVAAYSHRGERTQ